MPLDVLGSTRITMVMAKSILYLYNLDLKIWEILSNVSVTGIVDCNFNLNEEFLVVVSH
jgi:hypothetical protein